MAKQHSVKFNAVMNTILTSSTMLINLVTLPYVTRTLSVEGYGNVNFAQSLSSWLSTLCVVGVPTYAVRECARVRDDPKVLTQTVKEMLAIISFFTIFVLGIFAICILSVPRLVALAPLMWLFLVSTLLLSYGVEWYFQAVEQYEYITVRSIAFKFLSLVAILLFVHHPNDWLIYGAILALVTSGNNVFNIIRLLHDVPVWNSTDMNLHKHIKPLFSYAVMSISSSIYLFFDTVLLGMLNSNNVQVALYQLAAKLKGLCWSIVNAVIGVLIPRLSYYAKKDIVKYNALLERGFGFLLNMCIGATAYLFIFASPLVVLISSSKYISATVPVQIIGFVNFFSCMSYFIGLCVLSPLGRESAFARANLVGVPISLLLNLLLDNRFGAVGAAVSILVAEVGIFLKQVSSSYDILKKVIVWSHVVKTVASHLFAFLISVLVCLTAKKVGFNFLSMKGAFFAVLTGFISYSFSWFLFAVVLKEESAVYITHLLRNKFLKKLTEL